MNYPVLEILPELKLKLIETNVVILQAPPGAGKSTILPVELLDEGWLGDKKIVMLEPRRLAARSVAQRMASLKNEEVGEQIGYRVRFDTRTSKRTRIEVVTEGILTRMIQSDNSLEHVGLVIFDEFHERSLHADLALAMCLQAQQLLRNDLRILIMSATLDGSRLSSILNGAPILTSTGRQYPVKVYYVKQDEKIALTFRVVNVIRKALSEEQGDILVFLPGAGEINSVLTAINEETVSACLHPLYGDLPFHKQEEALLPDLTGRRKIVLATSIAETSLTIEGIRIVIDSGLSRVPKFDPRSGLTRLETIRVTKDSADQRAGRAGRLQDGVCYRLWSEVIHANLQPTRKAEIEEADLAPLVLELSEWGVRDVNELTWITKPPVGAVNQGKELLHQLGALLEGVITKRGREMLKLPTHPRIAHLLLEAIGNEKLLSAATDVAALLEERDPLDKNVGADMALRLEALRNWRKKERVYASTQALERIERVAANWRKILNCVVDNTAVADAIIGKLLMAAYPERIAQQVSKHNERYKLSNGRIASLPKLDPLMREEWLCVAQLDAGQGEGKIFQAAAVYEADLQVYAQSQHVIRWDDQRAMVTGVEERRIGNLVLLSKPLQTIPEEKRIQVLVEFIRRSGLKAAGWGEAQELWQARISSLKLWRPNENWPDVSEEKLLEDMLWLRQFLQNVYKQSDLMRLPWSDITTSLVEWDLSNRLNELAPVTLKVPSGSMIPVQYFMDGRAPIIEVRLQEMFGLVDTPAINEGRVKVILHLLSPGYKPVQVTQDLKSFWQTTYHEVRKQLRMRYPKHHWPEDPWTAQAVSGAKRKRNV